MFSFSIKICTDNLVFVKVTGPVGCSFCDYGFSGCNYLSSVELKLRLSVMIISPYIGRIISYEPPTLLPGNIFFSNFLMKTLSFRGIH
jgi:hypothetical protein